MRSGICTIQQALTVESETTVKQAISLARRRGHAQVTPLHVASALLSYSTGLLRKACLQCHSHPLQCKALELCFNVALNRLPASTQSPLLSHHYPNPSLSNALIAAFKRAQAHQRRGSIENQQQPILALKIELDQLIISILDDPSVSRVMREAGFSSTQVKNRVEQTVSLEICSSNSPKEISDSKPVVLSNSNMIQSSSLSAGHFGVPLNRPFDQSIRVNNDDVMSVFEELLTKRSSKRNTIIVGESEISAESVIRGVMDNFERGNIPRDLRFVQFISLPLFSLRNLSREDVEQRIMELRCTVKSYVGRGLVLYLGDLKRVSEFWSNYSEQRSLYSPWEQIVMEIKRLVCGIGDNSSNGRLWLMGIASFQTYMKCKAGHPSLESIWGLHPLTVPVGCLNLSLNLDRDCLGADEKEVRSLPISFHSKDYSTTPARSSTVSQLPSWLQQCRSELDHRRNMTTNTKECINVRDLCEKWNSFCNSTHKTSDPDDRKEFKFISSSSWELSSTFGSKQSSPKEYQFWVSKKDDLDVCDDDDQSNNELKPVILSNPNSSPNSASSSEVLEEIHDDLQKFKLFNSENLTILCEELEKAVPWQKGAIREVATTVLQCRSGTIKRREKFRENKEECWLFFLGNDSKAKEKIARELAKLVFGSQGKFVSIGLSSFSSTKIGLSTEESRNKRTRNELGCSNLQRFGEAVNENPHRVFFIEDIEHFDYCSQKGIKKAIEIGSVTLSDGELVPLKDAIVVFSCESFSSVSSRACSPSRRQFGEDKATDNMSGHDQTEEKSIKSISLDLNISIESEHEDEQSMAHTGILECVDGKIIININDQMSED